jgi:uncharacterized coiled-coil DUF342 family protein
LSHSRQNARSKERQEADHVANDAAFYRDKVITLTTKIDEYKNPVSTLVSEIRSEDGRYNKLYHTKRRLSARLSLKLRQLDVVIKDGDVDDEEPEASALHVLATQVTEFLAT